MTKDFNYIKTNVVELLEGGTSVLPSRYNYVCFKDYLNERFGDKLSELDPEQFDDETIKFIGLVIAINNKSSDVLVPIPEEEKDDVLNNFLDLYRIDKFDTNYNYYFNRKRTSLKEIIIEMYNHLKISGSPYYNFSYFDMRPLIQE